MTPKIDDKVRLTFLDQFRLTVQYDLTHCYVYLPNGQNVKAKTVRQAIDQAMKWSRDRNP